MKIHEKWYPESDKVLRVESDCANLRTQFETWTRDDTGHGYGDWKNILEYDSYDGKRADDESR